MNYASAVFAGFAIISVVWYIVRGRNNFKGPPVQSDVKPEQDGQIVGGRIGRVVTETEKTLDGTTGGKVDLVGTK
jgi:hypothetical protein